MGTKIDAARAVEILYQHERRLETYLGKKRTDCSDLLVEALLPFLVSIAGKEALADNSRKLGKSPVTRYNLPNPNKAIRNLCLSTAARMVRHGPRRSVIEVPEDFLLTHCVKCPCGQSVLVMRSDAEFCSQACQKRFWRRNPTRLTASNRK